MSEAISSEAADHLRLIKQRLSEQRESTQTRITAKATVYVVFACIVSASSGLLFGYDAGITGGVSNMPSFQDKFFPGLYNNHRYQTYYCKHNDQTLQLFASSLFFAGAVSSIPGSYISKRFGRTMTMSVAGMAFIVGSAILAGAVRKSMLMVGRCFWGVACGLADQAATIYSSEMAPPHLRGTLTMLFQLCIVTGILLAQCLNIGMHYLHPYGWRISLGLAAVPGVILLFGGLFLPETPNSLIERGYLQKGRAVLEAIRGTSEVDAEYGTIIGAYRRSMAAGENQVTTIMRREYRPHLAMSILCPLAQQWTGINAVIFFSPFIFQSLGNKFQGETGSLLATVIVGAVQEVATIAGMFLADKVGRRQMLIQTIVQSLIAQVVLAGILAHYTSASTVLMGPLPSKAAIILICLFVEAYARGWGPYGWVISSEIQPLETRCLGQGVTVFMSMINSAIIGQCFLTMLCTLEWGVYVLFTVCQLGGLLFCIFLLPETKGIPIEMVKDVFKVHWYWKRFNSPEDPEGTKIQQDLEALLQQRKQARKGKGNDLGSPKHSTESSRLDGTFKLPGQVMKPSVSHKHLNGKSA